MPDIRTLLDDVTARAPHPDPVTAVHGTVRRRAARRRNAVLAGTAFVVAAAALVVVNGGRPGEVEPAAGIPEWREYSRGDWPYEDNLADPVFVRAARLVHENHTVFVGFESAEIVDHYGKYVFGLSAGVDPGDWATAMDEAVGRGKWTATVCKNTAEGLDRAAEEGPTAQWPSGARFRNLQYEAPCQLWIGLTSGSRADQDFATRRWGPEVAAVRTVPASQPYPPSHAPRRP